MARPPRQPVASVPGREAGHATPARLGADGTARTGATLPRPVEKPPGESGLLLADALPGHRLSSARRPRIATAGTTPLPNHPSKGITRSSTDRPNTLNLQAKGVERLASRLDQTTSKGKSERNAAFKRSYVRMPFRLESVGIRLIHPGGSVSELKLASRNLSSGGISLLHNRFVHLGTSVVVLLPLQGSGFLDVRGTVRRCVHLSTVVHEIGIEFEKKIDARQFMRADKQSAFFSLEKVDPARVRGCVVLIDPGGLDQKIFRHLLRNTELRIRAVDSIDEAMPIIAEGCDLIAADLSRDIAAFPLFMDRLRQQGVLTPVIAITADNSTESQSRLADARVNAILTKPLTEGKLLQAVAEFLLSDDKQAVPAAGVEDVIDATLVRGFLDELTKYADELTCALRTGDCAKCVACCAQIKGTAPVLGFQGLAKLAGAAAESLAATADTQESARAIEDLVIACRRAERSAA